MSETEGLVGNLIFLSYRRADTAPHTLALKLELEGQLRAARVFVDTHTIQGGDVWPSQIENALKSAKVVVPVIGKAWLAKEADGTRRIDNDEDWVHREIRLALALKKGALVPLLVDDARPLRAQELPAELQELASIQPLKLDINDWDKSIGLIVKVLRDKFEFARKPVKYTFPKPDPLVSKTIAIPWDELDASVREHLPSWRIEFSDDPERLQYTRVELARDFEFKSFKRAMEFVQIVAAHAKTVDHHPRWMNIWRTVTIWLSTWDAGHRVTALDVEFARFLEREFKNFRSAR
jgi:pterin-4a-carbinolamine dehydratase